MTHQSKVFQVLFASKKELDKELEENNKTVLSVGKSRRFDLIKSLV